MLNNTLSAQLLNQLLEHYFEPKSKQLFIIKTHDQTQ